MAGNRAIAWLNAGCRADTGRKMVETKITCRKSRTCFGHLFLTGLAAATAISIAVGSGPTSGADNATSGSNSLSAATQGADQLDGASRAKIFRDVLSKFAAGKKPGPVLFNQFVSIQNANVRTGPKIGDQVPDFTLPDQDARKHTLHDLMGTNGLLLVFVRSADW